MTALPQYKESKRVSLYLSTKDEIDTIKLLKDLFQSKREVFVPRYDGREMQMVKLHSMSDYEKLPLTKWGIKQPDKSENRENALETGNLKKILNIVLSLSTLSHIYYDHYFIYN